jgi:glyoxylase I family protein
MGLVKGLHHASLKCCNQKEYDEVIKFYRDILQIPVYKEWGTGIMLDTGAGIIEVFNDAESQLAQGVIRHFALATDDVDACVKTVAAAGYEVTVQPCDVDIDSQPPFSVRCAFCKGPLGEEIEFFTEK